MMLSPRQVHQRSGIWVVEALVLQEALLLQTSKLYLLIAQQLLYTNFDWIDKNTY